MVRIILTLGCVLTIALSTHGGALGLRPSTASGAEAPGAQHSGTPGAAHKVTGTPAQPFVPAQRQMTAAGQVVPKTHQVTLVARRTEDGSLTYNGTIPGPTIEIYEGDEVQLTLVNELDVDVSVHVHGVHYKIDSDGTRHTRSFAPPGGKYVYRWTAPPGTAGYWHYHDHVIGPRG